MMEYWYESDDWEDFREKESMVKELELSGNDKLEKVIWERNGQIETMDFRGLSRLKKLKVTGELPNLENICLKKMSMLERMTLRCPRLSRLDVSECPRLKVLDVNDCGLQKLNLNQNPKLEQLYARKNKLVSLNINRLKNLRHISVWDNRLKELVINGREGNRITVWCQRNRLTRLTFLKHAVPYTVNCRKNLLKKIEVPRKTKRIMKDKKTKIIKKD